MIIRGLAPDTYDQIRWAAILYRCPEREKFYDFDAAYHTVNNDVFKQRMVENFDHSVANQLADFLKDFRIRGNRDELAYRLYDARQQTMTHLRSVIDLPSLETDLFTPNDMNAIERAFDYLKSIKQIGPTSAAKILAVLNPELFVMWDNEIAKKYIPRSSQHRGVHYRSFLRTMRQATHDISKDALESSIENPAKHLSETCPSVPNFTLAKFIDEWNYLTITRGEKYPHHHCSIQH